MAESINSTDLAFVFPVTDKVIAIYLSDSLQVARELTVGHDLNEFSIVAVDHEPLVVPVHDEDVALVVSDDSGGLRNMSGNIAMRGVDNLNPCHYICRVKPSKKECNL